MLKGTITLTKKIDDGLSPLSRKWSESGRQAENVFECGQLMALRLELPSYESVELFWTVYTYVLGGLLRKTPPPPAQACSVL